MENQEDKSMYLGMNRDELKQYNSLIFGNPSKVKKTTNSTSVKDQKVSTTTNKRSEPSKENKSIPKNKSSISLKQLETTDESKLEEVLCSWVDQTKTEPDLVEIDGAIVKRIIEVASSTEGVALEAIKFIGNIASGNDFQTQLILDANYLQFVKKLLKEKPRKKTLIKELIWTISNITAGSESQIKEVVDSGVLDDIYPFLQNNEDVVKLECLWVLSNAFVSNYAVEQFMLKSTHVIRDICAVLPSTSPKAVLVALNTVESLLKVSAHQHKCVELIEECSGLDYIEQLQAHSDTEIYKKATKLLETYFSSEEDQDGGAF